MAAVSVYKLSHHVSILKEIVGQPIQALPIDVQVRLIKASTLLLLGVFALIWIGQSMDLLP